MKRTALLGVLLAVVLGAGASARAQAAPPADAKGEIESQVKKFMAAVNARDVSGLMSFYAPGNQLYVFDAIPPRAYVGWDAYKKDWEGLLASYPGPVSAKVLENHITVVGPVAYSYGVQAYTFTDKAGKKANFVIRLTDIFRKTGGKWLVVHEHVSFPVDPDSGKADMMSKP